MKTLLLILLTLSLAGSASAQAPMTSDAFTGARTSVKREFFKLRTHEQPASRPMVEDTKLSYFDASLPVFEWVAPAVYGEYTILDLGQRFTLPTEYGFVDSVRIYFDSASGARLAISLVSDTLFDTGAGLFHLMNDFVPQAPYGASVIEAEAITPGSWVTFDMGHALVPKEFFVRVTPEDDGQNYIASYTLRTEQEPVHARTAENARSAFYGLFGQDLLTAILDSTFYSLETDEILMGDFWMEAFVDVSSSSVARSAEKPFSVYPNPVTASGPFHIRHLEAMTSVVVTNMLGAEVARWDGSDLNVDIPTRGLAKGIYQLLIRTDADVRSEKLIVN